jgi:Phage integrase, N-terminal SAM-like domain
METAACSQFHFVKELSMTPVRQRMTEDMQVRNLSPHTQASYIQQVSLFARYFGKSPEVLGSEEIRAYQVYLTNEKKLASSAGAEPQCFFVCEIIKRGVFRRCQIRPSQAAVKQIFAAVPDNVQERIVGFGNPIELTGYHAGDGRSQRDRPNPCAAVTQFFIALVTLAEIAHNPGKSLQFAAFIAADRVSSRCGSEPFCSSMK